MTTNIQQVIERCTVLQSDPAFDCVEAIIVGGSVGRSEQDPLSDLDFFLLLTYSEGRDFVTRTMARVANRIGTVLLFRGPVFVDGFGFSFTALYDTLLVCQFNVNTRSTLPRSPMQGLPYITCFDRTGYYTTLLQSVDTGAAISERDIFLRTFTFFWLRSMNVWRSLMRGELWLAIRYSHDMRDQLFLVERLVRRRWPPGLQFQLPSKSFESDMGIDMACSLANTLPTYSRESIVFSLRSMIGEFGSLTKVYMSDHDVIGSRELDAAQAIENRLAADLWSAG